jgi:hypothetical protein
MGRAGTGNTYSTSTSTNDIVLRSDNKLLLQSDLGAVAMCVDTSNHIGIGKTNPSSSYKLDVSGNINCNGIYVNGPQFTGTPSWSSVTNKPFTILNTTSYSPSASQTECEIIMDPKAEGTTDILLTESVLFIGTQFSILYTFMYLPS